MSPFNSKVLLPHHARLLGDMRLTPPSGSDLVFLLAISYQGLKPKKETRRHYIPLYIVCFEHKAMS